MSKVTAKVFNPLYTAELAPLASAVEELGFRVEENEVGSGGFRVHKDKSVVSLLDDFCIVQFLIDGTPRFSTFLGPWDQETKPASGKNSDALRTYRMNGTLGLLAYEAVYPELGIGRNSPDHRLFNFSSTDHDPSGWDDAVEIKQQSASTPAQWLYDDNGVDRPAPQSWPDPDAWWIWSQAQGVGSPPQPVGFAYFVTTFEVLEAHDVRIFISADDGFELYLDGALVTNQREAFMWQDTRYADYYLDAGVHKIAIRAENIDRPSADTNIAGVIASVVEVSNGGDVLGNVLCRTDATWKTLGYPASPPGMTPGAILATLLAEAQLAGGLVGWTKDFTETLDSAGNPWSEIDIGFSVAQTSLLDVVMKLAEADIDVGMAPDGLTLRAWVKPKGGASGVTLGSGMLESLSHSGRPKDLTVVLARHLDGRWVEISSGDDDRRVGFLQLGGAPSDERVQVEADAQFDAHARQVLHKVGVAPTGGVVPFDDFDIGQTVTVEDETGVTALRRVVTIDVSSDQNANATFVVEAM